ncbi:MAG: hypothetical protein AAFO51_02190, partial [Pseudomonadota bacterium]
VSGFILAACVSVDPETVTGRMERTTIGVYVLCASVTAAANNFSARDRTIPTTLKPDWGYTFG